MILQFGKGLRFARPYLKDQTADTTWVWDQMKTRVREAVQDPFFHTDHSTRLQHR